ncbi:hypothetical protein Sjap_017113 [Stephania japonica]|uniref:Uncharacterized protein n=1 Tax=Stephania japonica TaxID=461633 RepID=A0AAP0I5M6_9MAGN
MLCDQRCKRLECVSDEKSKEKALLKKIKQRSRISVRGWQVNQWDEIRGQNDRNMKSIDRSQQNSLQ